MIVLKHKGIRMIGFLIVFSLFICDGFSRADESKPADSLNNPFEMRGGKGEDNGFVSAALVDLPTGIRVLGILAVKGRDTIGVLEIPGMPDAFFVKSGDVIQVESSGKADKTAVLQCQLYLLVKSVSTDEIILAPRTRPQDSRIYR